MNADAGGWVNPYRYDGRDRARYDASDGLYWLTTRAYDPTLGRFLARDPLGRVPLFFADNPYAYAGNNPVSNVDPSGQYRAAGAGSTARESGAATNAMMARVVAKGGCGQACKKRVHSEWVAYQAKLTNQRIATAKGIAKEAAAYFRAQAGTGLTFGFELGSFKPTLLPLKGTPTISSFLTMFEAVIGTFIVSLSGSPLLTLGFAGWATAVLTYDIVSALPLAYFQHEATASDDWWRDSANIVADSIAMGMILEVVGALVIAFCTLVAAAAPEYGIILTGVFVGYMLAVLRILPSAQAYFVREERAMTP